MRIVIISDWFVEKMGYAENALPKALASLGHEVHLITSNVQVYFNSPTYKETYEPFIGPAIVDCTVKSFDGYTLHRLPHKIVRGRLHIVGLANVIQQLRPEIVQAFEVLSLSTQVAAIMKLKLGYKLFLQSHIHASVFDTRHKLHLKSLLYKSIGRLISLTTEKCYPISQDAAEIAINFLGIQKGKIEINSLGVDTDLFCPPLTPESQQIRAELRQQLGFANSDLVCLYSGRFSEDKNPLLLAQAIDQLIARGVAVRGLFIGNGPQAAAIQACKGCVITPFVPVRDLPPLYWATDIGVWPKQESTSQLDAAAAGLPLILSHHVYVRERINGNGLLFEDNDVQNLMMQIQILTDPQIRHRFSQYGVEKIRTQLSWQRIAQQRLKDYEAALGKTTKG